MNTGSKRIAIWDNAKFILILLVVIGHFAEQYKGNSQFFDILFTWIYAFHMPVFIFISGLFSKSTVGNEQEPFRLYRILSYLCIYVLYKIAKYLLLRYGFAQTVRFRLFWADGLEWYMLSMAAWISLTVLFRRIRFSVMVPCIIGVSLLSGFENSVGDTVSLARIINYYLFFYLGYSLEARKVYDFLNRRTIRAFGAAAFVIFSVLVALYTRDGLCIKQYVRLFTGHNSYDTIRETLVNVRIPVWVCRLLWYPGVLVLGTGFLSLIPRRVLPGLTSFGARTLQVYFLHRLVLDVCKYTGFLQALGHCSILGIGYPIWVLLVAVLLTLLLSSKIFSYPFDKILSCRFRCFMNTAKH